MDLNEILLKQLLIYFFDDVIANQIYSDLQDAIYEDFKEKNNNGSH